MASRIRSRILTRSSLKSIFSIIPRSDLPRAAAARKISFSFCGYRNTAVVSQAGFRSIHTFSVQDEVIKQYMQNLVQRSNEGDPDPLHRVATDILSKQEELKELDDLSKDPELKDVAAADTAKILDQLSELQAIFFAHVLEEEPLDLNDVSIEVAAGIGGQEAMLFAGELFTMYENYAAFKGFEWGLTMHEPTEAGGVRKAGATVSGRGAYKLLKFEGGVHRVQRVPKTERAGRVHTSTATVAILPVPTEVDVVLSPQDLVFEAKKASGAGGQHVNTTESAVRLTHKPSGIVVECQMERSQIRNREVAVQLLRTKLYQQKLEAQQKNIRDSRKLQVGLAGRSEKIRTYNFGQDRCTDHRIGFNCQNLKDILSGGSSFDNIVASLLEFDRNERLQQVFTQVDNDKSQKTSRRVRAT